MLISVHMPKTAGTSFLATLELHFGAALLKDYADLPINTPPAQRHRSALENALRNSTRDFAGIDCIHGHFLPAKYLTAASSPAGVQFITWMRDPVDRVVSHFHFWKNYHDPASAGALHSKVVAEDWSLERFTLGSELQNLYSQFLWAFPPWNFDFIGITEHYAADLEYFTRRHLGKPASPQMLNLAPALGESRHIDDTLRKKIEAHHALDMGLYRAALEKRAARK